MSRRSLLAGCVALAPVFLSTGAMARALAAPAAGSFAVEGDHFLLDGKPFQVIAGEIHYARVPREYWQHRVRMAKAMGLNTIATYVFWNLHEPQPGVYDFAGMNDLAAFLRAVQAEGMHVLLRAGPYACAEWEFGGFPAWLLKDPKMRTALRANDDAFMVPAERWLKRLAVETAPLLIANGGPILAVQVENEYGNFSNDKAYMRRMLGIFEASAWKGALFYTVDPSKALANGSIEGILSGVNFGTGSSEQGLARLAAMRPGAPLFATEYWPGWFDLFGHPHETRPVAPQLKDIENVLSHNGSINIYMFHGGTNFGMMAGASASTGNYRGNVTSYDYDSPLDEAGHTTPKFFSYRDVILKYSRQPKVTPPAPPPVIAVPEFTLSHAASLWDYLPVPVAADKPLTMEMLGQSYGYVLYRTKLAAATVGPLVIPAVHDYAQVYVDGKLVGTLDRHYNQTTVALSTDGPAVLDILVENTGRLNSTRNMRTEWKGIESASLGETPLTGWQMYSLPMQYGQLPKGTPAQTAGPAHFQSGSFTLDKAGDTFLDIAQLGKGVLWINGRCLGRFWNIGPQQTLYLPGPWLKKGTNEVMIFDLFAAAKPPKLVGRTKAILDGPTPTYADDAERKKKADPNAEFGPRLAAPAAPAVRPKE